MTAPRDEPVPLAWPDDRGLALIGYRGAGKTTVGRLLAGATGRPFADADAELVARSGCDIPRFFAERGEPAFRDAEQAVLADLCARPRLVLATGGGAVLREANRAALRRLGPIVWLRAAAEELAGRLRAGGAAGRPALTSKGTLEEIAEVLAAREPIYRATADLAIDTDGLAPGVIAERILAALRVPRPTRGGR